MIKDLTDLEFPVKQEQIFQGVSGPFFAFSV
jgi:hypothetical protein